MNFCLRVASVFVFVLVGAVSGPTNAQEDPNALAGGPMSFIHKMCPSTTIQICGVPFTPPNGFVGTIAKFTLPAQFEERDASLRCVVDRAGVTRYIVMNGSVPTCALKSCDMGPVTLCDAALPIKQKLRLGEVTKVGVPPELIARESGVSVPTFTARCALVGDAAKYEVADAAGVSCNAFLCQPAKIQICGSTVDVPTTSKLGTVYQLKTATNQPVTVQCLASGGHAPMYVVTNNSCRNLPTSP